MNRPSLELAKEVLTKEELCEFEGVFHNTGIDDFKVHKTTLAPMETTRITGKVVIQTFHVGGWGPKENAEVQLFQEGAKIDTTDSDDDGNFEFIYRAPESPAVYFVEAKHPGEWDEEATGTDRIPITVEKEEEKPPEKPPEEGIGEFLSKYKPYIIAGGVALGSTVIISEVTD